MGKEASFACMKAGNLLVPCSVCLIQAEALLALPYNDQREYCVERRVLSLWHIQSCLILAETVNKGATDNY